MAAIPGITGAALDIASSGTSSIATSVLASTQQLVADETARLFATLGLGTNVNTHA